MNQQAEKLSSYKCYRALPKYNKTKVLTFAFNLYKGFSKKQKEVWNYSRCLIFCVVFQ